MEAVRMSMPRDQKPLVSKSTGSLMADVEKEITYIRDNADLISKGTIKVTNSIRKLRKMMPENPDIKITKTKYAQAKEKVRRYGKCEKITHIILGAAECGFTIRELAKRDDEDNDGWRIALYVLTVVWAIAIITSGIIHCRVRNARIAVESIEELLPEEVIKVRSLLDWLEAIQNEKDEISTFKALPREYRKKIAPDLYKKEELDDEHGLIVSAVARFLPHNHAIAQAIQSLADKSVPLDGTTSLTLQRKGASSDNRLTQSAPPTVREPKGASSMPNLQQAFDGALLGHESIGSLHSQDENVLEEDLYTQKWKELEKLTGVEFNHLVLPDRKVIDWAGQLHEHKKADSAAISIQDTPLGISSTGNIYYYPEGSQS